jgi:hypothetical protein
MLDKTWLFDEKLSEKKRDGKEGSPPTFNGGLLFLFRYPNMRKLNKLRKNFGGISKYLQILSLFL